MSYADVAQLVTRMRVLIERIRCALASCVGRELKLVNGAHGPTTQQTNTEIPERKERLENDGQIQEADSSVPQSGTAE